MGGSGNGALWGSNYCDPKFRPRVEYRPDPEFLRAEKEREERDIRKRLQAARSRDQVWPGVLANAYLAKGLKAARLAALGFTPKELHQGGSSITELLEIFSISHLEEAGIKVKVKELKPDQILKDLDSA